MGVHEVQGTNNIMGHQCAQRVEEESHVSAAPRSLCDEPAARRHLEAKEMTEGPRRGRAHPNHAMIGKAIALRWPRPRRAGGTKTLCLPDAPLNAARTAQRAVRYHCPEVE